VVAAAPASRLVSSTRPYSLRFQHVRAAAGGATHQATNRGLRSVAFPRPDGIGEPADGVAELLFCIQAVSVRASRDGKQKLAYR
jgi:hypothetical protein